MSDNYQVKKECININDMNFIVENRGFQNFGCFVSGKNRYKLLSVKGPQKRIIKLIQSIYDGNFADVKVHVENVDTGRLEYIQLSEKNQEQIFEILLYAWYLKYGKDERVLLQDKEILSKNVDNKIFLKENSYFYFHRILSEQNEFKTVLNITNNDFPVIRGVLVNHEKGKAKIIDLNPKEYVYRTVGAYLLDSINISPSFIFDKKELHMYTEEQLKEFSKYSRYNPKLKFSDKKQPSLKNL